MASATLIPGFVPEPTPATIQLELSAEEAVTLMSIFGRIGGNPENTLRRYTDSIYDALSITIDISLRPDHDLMHPGQSRIYFKEGSIYDPHFLSSVKSIR